MGLASLRQLREVLALVGRQNCIRTCAIAELLLAHPCVQVRRTLSATFLFFCILDANVLREPLVEN